MRPPSRREIDHYNLLVCKTIESVVFEDFEDQPLPVLKFKGGGNAVVLCDPEGNGPGFLEINLPVAKFCLMSNTG